LPVLVSRSVTLQLLAGRTDWQKPVLVEVAVIAAGEPVPTGVTKIENP